MSISRRRRTLIPVLVVAVFSAVAFGVTAESQAVLWGFGTDQGVNAEFNWANGRHDGEGGTANQLGSPTVTMSGFIFQNEFGDMNFNVVPGTSINTITRVNVVDPAGVPQITVHESGIYGGNPADITHTHTLDLFRTAPGFPGTSGNIPFPPITFAADGTWHVDMTIDVTSIAWVPSGPDGLPLNDFQVTLVNIFSVNAAAPAGTFVQKTRAEVIVPEPASLMLLAGGCVPLLLRRRASRRRARRD
ncbi:MAG: PEP-CTERM sorting domain-containing protein [Phycisphaerae bacterium]